MTTITSVLLSPEHQMQLDNIRANHNTITVVILIVILHFLLTICVLYVTGRKIKKDIKNTCSRVDCANRKP